MLLLTSLVAVSTPKFSKMQFVLAAALASVLTYSTPVHALLAMHCEKHDPNVEPPVTLKPVCWPPFASMQSPKPTRVHVGPGAVVVAIGAGGTVVAGWFGAGVFGV